jgi:hypothetical protein
LPDRTSGPIANQSTSIDSAGDDAVAPPRRRIPPPSLADLHAVGEPVEAGDVVVIDRLNGTLRPSATLHDRNVIGVVAFVEGQVPPGDEAPVVVAGTVPCNVDAEYGPIAAGDLLVTSPTIGHAMRSTKPAAGTVLGKAMESLESGRGTIKILVLLR